MPESRKRKKKTTPTPHATTQSAATPSPKWWAPTMSTLMVVGLVWVVATYLFRGSSPSPGSGTGTSASASA